MTRKVGVHILALGRTYPERTRPEAHAESLHRHARLNEWKRPPLYADARSAGAPAAARLWPGRIRPPGKWEWTLNWDPIVYDKTAREPLYAPSEDELAAAGCIIGSCPRTPADVDRLVDEGGVEAIICLQCELCHGALQIDWEPIRARALERGVPIVRVSVRDFDRLDQAKMLPEVRPP